MTSFAHANRDDWEFAYSQLSMHDKLVIDRAAATIEQNVKARAYFGKPQLNVNFGRQEALELLFKLGCYMKENDL